MKYLRNVSNAWARNSIGKLFSNIIYLSLAHKVYQTYDYRICNTCSNFPQFKKILSGFLTILDHFFSKFWRPGRILDSLMHTYIREHQTMDSVHSLFNELPTIYPFNRLLPRVLRKERSYFKPPKNGATRKFHPCPPPVPSHSFSKFKAAVE